MTLASQPAVLVIAGVDSSGGAGLTRDVRVLTQFNVEPLCAVTAVTAQSNARVATVHHVPPEVIRAQILTVFETRPIGAIKIGMLGTTQTVEAVAESLPPEIPLVLDPVLVASSGGVLLDQDGRQALRSRLLSRASLITPNIPELAALLEEPIAQGENALIRQGHQLLEWGAQAILIKGGHGQGEEAVDLLIRSARARAATVATRVEGQEPATVDTRAEGQEPANTAQQQGIGVVRFASRRVRATQRGTGCALASAIAAGLASGLPLESACARAKEYLTQWLAQA